MRSLPNTIALLTVSLPLLAYGGPSVETTGLDAITTLGIPVRLQAKFERIGVGPFQPDMARAKVRFSVLGKSFMDLTDPDGIAEATVCPVHSGVFPIQAKLLEHGSIPAATGTLYAVATSRAVAVVDIDGTLSNLPGWQVPFRAEKAETFQGAPALLKDLSKTHQIVYLTARDLSFAKPTRRFLARHGFPSGPVLFNTWGLVKKHERDQLRPSKHGEFKLKTIRRLQTRGLRVTLGIGNAETDAEAYEGAKIKSCILTDKQGSGKTFRFQTYEQLRKKLKADGVL